MNASTLEEEHEHCGCGHDHHDHCECGCEHEHHEHDHDHCGCGHEHHEHEHHGHCECGCEHEHHHDHGHCECGHEHHEHEHHGHCECGCEHEHHHDHGHCECGHDHHDHDHDHCGCGCGHSHEHFSERELSAEPTFSYHVLGVDCPNCANNVQNAVRALPSVQDARLVYATATLDVVMDSGASLQDCKREVLNTVRSCGEDLEMSQAELEELEAQRSWFAENRERVLMGLSAFMLVAGLVTELLLHNEARANIFYIMAALAGIVFVAPMAWAALRRRTADMNVLMAIAVIGGLIIGFTGDPSVFRDAAIVIFLDQVGEWLEGWSMRKTSGSVRELMDLAPSVSHVVTPEGTTVDVQTKGVSEGYTIRILPGERIPLDGVIVAGESSFNEAPVTGESVPQDKGIGAEVYAGSLNSQAVVDVRVTADEDCTTLARIVSQVQGAQAQKAPYESFVNRFAAIYTPIVVVGAAILGIGIPLMLTFAYGGWNANVWHEWAYRACSLLVVACPCALVISTPVSFVSALSCAARQGVLVKGGAYFDIATKVTNIAFDKTGTLTSGQPKVVKIMRYDTTSEGDVLAVAAALESASTHPLARAVVEEARKAGAKQLVGEHIQEVSANGMRGLVAGERCTIGKLAFAEQQAMVGSKAREAVEELGKSGATALVVTRSGEVLGIIGVADTPRDSARPMVEAFAANRRAPQLEMLTGDNAYAAQAVASATGVDRYAAEMLPGDKLSHIAELQNEGGVVAMVGDGINDAPALAQADLGITIGAAASDTALEVADVALLSDESLEMLPAFFFLARRTMNVVRENIAFAIGVKALVFVLVVLGMAGMGAAVFADTGVALLVVLNGMRLMRPSKLLV